MELLRLRTVQKYRAAYPKNKFPKHFPVNLGREIVYLLATRTSPRLEGNDWEEIFANLIGATWSPSNVGLDDIVLGHTAWGAKTVKNRKPSTAFKVRLISGRNNPGYSFGSKAARAAKHDPEKVGKQILSIWNARIYELGRKFKHLRTIVLIKSNDLREVAVFEFETVRYQIPKYQWQWNENGNLEVYTKGGREHRFTWQPHGSQFTIIEDVPKSRLAIRVSMPPQIDHGKVLKELKFDKTWVTILE